MFDEHLLIYVIPFEVLTSNLHLEYFHKMNAYFHQVLFTNSKKIKLHFFLKYWKNSLIWLKRFSKIHLSCSVGLKLLHHHFSSVLTTGFSIVNILFSEQDLFIYYTNSDNKQTWNSSIVSKFEIIIANNGKWIP